MISFTFPQYGLVIEAENIEEANKKMSEIITKKLESDKKNTYIGEKKLDDSKIKNKGKVGTSKK